MKTGGTVLRNGVGTELWFLFMVYWLTVFIVYWLVTIVITQISNVIMKTFFDSTRAFVQDNDFEIAQF